MNRLFWILLLCVLPGIAYADNEVYTASGKVWDLYVFGNGPAVAGILKSINAMVATPGYRHLLWFLATAAMFGWGIVIGMSAQNIQKFAPFFVSMLLVLYFLVGFPGVNNSKGLVAYVNVIDRNDTSTVNFVPTAAVVGIPAAIISQIGNWLTKSVELNFSTPQQLQMRGGSSFMMGQRLLNDATQIHIRNPYLRESMSSYVQDCVIPMMAVGSVDPAGLLSSTNVWKDLKSENEGVMTVYWGQQPSVRGGQASRGGEVRSCKTAYTNISDDLVTYAPELLTAAAGAAENTPIFSYTSASLDSAMTWFSGGGAGARSGSGAEAIKQTAVINTFQGSFASAAAMSNNSEMMTAISTAQAEKSQKSGWIAAAQLMNNMMGYVYAFLQAFVIGIGPIMAAALLIPGLGFAVLKNYLQILLWLVMWDPLMAIVQYIMAIYGAQDLAPILAIAGGGFTMSNMVAVTEKTNNMLIAGAFFATTIPLLAWGLVKGSIAFTEFISHGIGANMGQAAGAQAATGNLNLDNVSMGNMAMHKSSMEWASTGGAKETVSHHSGASASSVFSAGGSVAGTAAGNGSTVASAKRSDAIKESKAKADDYTKSASETKTTADQLSVGLGRDLVSSASTSSKGGASGSKQDGAELDKSVLVSAANAFRQAVTDGKGEVWKNTFNQEMGYQAKFGVGAKGAKGGKSDGAPTAGAELAGGTSRTWVNAGTHEAAVKTSIDKANQATAQYAEGVKTKQGEGTTQSVGAEGSTGMTDSDKKAYLRQKSAALQIQQLETASQKFTDSAQVETARSQELTSNITYGMKRTELANRFAANNPGNSSPLDDIKPQAAAAQLIADTNNALAKGKNLTQRVDSDSNTGTITMNGGQAGNPALTSQIRNIDSSANGVRRNATALTSIAPEGAQARQNLANSFENKAPDSLTSQFEKEKASAPPLDRTVIPKTSEIKEDAERITADTLGERPGLYTEKEGNQANVDAAKSKLDADKKARRDKEPPLEPTGSVL